MTHSAVSSATPAVVFSLLLALAWLLPNHYLPWPAFHSDLAAAVALATASWLALARRHQRPLELALPAAFFVALASIPLLQLLGGLIHFAGDAWMAALYLCGAGIAAQLGFSLRQRDLRAAEALAWALLVAGIVSVGLALAQWFRLSGLGVFVESLDPRQPRAFANFGQPNQFASFLMLGLASTFWLFELRRVGRSVLWLAAAFLCVGVALSQSRAAYLEMLGLLIWLWLQRDRASLRLTRSDLVVIGLWFFCIAFGMMVWADLQSTGMRTTSDAVAPGRRPLHWAAVADAVGRSPWLGYGWNQVSVAVAAVAADHPPTWELIEHSHNLVLDLLVWNGVVLGFAIMLVASTWMYRRIQQCQNAEATFLIACLGVLLVHSMLELPLEYAYFLLPAAYVAGALAALAPATTSVTLPRAVPVLVLAAATSLTAWVAVEYVRFEENHRALRFESAGIGADRVARESPPALLLTQLLAFNRFARSEARRGMSNDELATMRKVAERFGYPPVLFRFALALGVNGRPREAEAVLVRLCKLGTDTVCSEGRENWRLAGDGQYPELRSIPFPSKTH